MSLLVAYPGPATFDDDGAAIPAGLHELSFPLAIARDPGLDGGEVDGEARLEQDMTDPAQSLPLGPAVEFLGPRIPEGHAARGVADEDGVVGEIEQIRLQADLLCLLEALALGGARGAHITHGAQRVERAV